MAKRDQRASRARKTQTPQKTIQNPFERRTNKPRFTVFGRRLKATEQKTGQARGRSIENV